MIDYFGYSGLTGSTSPIRASVRIDAKDSTRYAISIDQSGLGLPNRDYYLNDSERFVGIRKEYRSFITSLFELAEIAGSSDAAERILTLETRIATGHWTRVQNRDRDKTYNKLSLSDLDVLTGNFDWARYFRERDFNDIESVVIRQPGYLVALSELVKSVSISDWKTYLTFHALNGKASFLTKEFDEANFAFQVKIW